MVVKVVWVEGGLQWQPFNVKSVCFKLFPSSGFLQASAKCFPAE